MAHLSFVGNSVASVTEVTSSFGSAYQSKIIVIYLARNLKHLGWFQHGNGTDGTDGTHFPENFPNSGDASEVWKFVFYPFHLFWS